MSQSYPLAPPRLIPSSSMLEDYRLRLCPKGMHTWRHEQVEQSRGFSGINDLLCVACSLRVKIAQVVQP